MARAAQKKFPGATLRVMPLADGGDGTLEVLRLAWGGKLIFTMVEGPLGIKVKAAWGFFSGQGRRHPVAVIEMARASGLALVRGRNRIMDATSFGTGQLIRAALNKGCRNIILGVGGTACADGGAGALRALGLKYFDRTNQELSARPRDLLQLHRVEWTDFDGRLRKAKINILCDVTNPLLGQRGSARIFGPQKGATPIQVRQLEAMLRRWSMFAPRKVAMESGAGAAGALAFGLAGFAGAHLRQGTPAVMRALKWGTEARKADLILTGEGRLDQTSFQGKVVGEVVARKGRAQVMVVCGSSTLSPREIKNRKIFRVERLKEFI